MAKRNEPSEVATTRPEVLTPEAENTGELPQIDLESIAGGLCNIKVPD